MSVAPVPANASPVDSTTALHDDTSGDTFGDRLADRVAAFGGSWTFILLFLAFLILWAVLNTEILGPRKEAFDPYPYIFLNLFSRCSRRYRRRSS